MNLSLLFEKFPHHNEVSAFDNQLKGFIIIINQEDSLFVYFSKGERCQVL
jgi:hypothetical protein